MAATVVTFADKISTRSLPTVAIENKVRDVDMNELKDAINDNAALQDINTSNITTNSANITANTTKLAAAGENFTNTLDLTNTLGTHHSQSNGNPLADLTFSLAGGVVTGGWALIYSNASDAPIIYGATARNDYTSNYSAGADNFILVWAFGPTQEVYYQLA